MFKPKIEKHRGYQVKVQRLKGGVAANTETQTLYFLYTTPFHDFLNALRDATLLCEIPPVEVEEKGRVIFRKPALDVQTNEPESATQTPRRRGLLTPHDSFSVELPSPEYDAPREAEKVYRERDGYMLSDGAWIYKRQKIHFRNGTELKVAEDSLSKIEDEADYWAMVKLLKKANSAEKMPEGSRSRTGTPNEARSSPIPEKVNILDPQYDHRFTHRLWIMHVSFNICSHFLIVSHEHVANDL